MQGERMKNIRMKRIVFSFFLTFTFLSYLQAQFDAQSSQYMLNAPGFNPAAAGESGMMDITGQHRLQWVGMPNGGSTTIFNINAPVNFDAAVLEGQRNGGDPDKVRSRNARPRCSDDLAARRAGCRPLAGDSRRGPRIARQGQIGRAHV